MRADHRDGWDFSRGTLRSRLPRAGQLRRRPRPRERRGSHRARAGPAPERASADGAPSREPSPSCGRAAARATRSPSAVVSEAALADRASEPASPSRRPAARARAPRRSPAARRSQRPSRRRVPRALPSPADEELRITASEAIGPGAEARHARRRAPRRRAERHAKVIAFANQKGGVAKTTTTLNLAVAFAETGHRVLCVDMDPQGNLTMSQGIDPDTVEKSMYDVLVDNMPIREVIRSARSTSPSPRSTWPAPRSR